MTFPFLILCELRKIGYNSSIVLNFSIRAYATTHTKESVYIIGGITDGGMFSYSSTIAQFKDYIWMNAGKLSQARFGHGAITLEGETMIIGGTPYLRDT